ncbi:MAG: rod shape-determining protein MreC [bacterium]|nr:rod shape-determining protein MreC [bacterium]
MYKKNPQNPISTLALSSVLSGIIFILSLIGINEPLSNGLLFILSPPLKSLNGLYVQVNNELSTLTQVRAVSKKYKAAIEQNLELRAQIARLKKIEDENSRLREQIGAPALEKFKLTPAQVINKERTLTVTFDRNTHIVKDSIAVYKNHFVGKVQSSTANSAIILLATDPQMSLPVDIIGHNGAIINAVLVGDFGTGMNLVRIDQSALVNSKDLVVVSKIPGLPEGLVVGEIREVSKRESDLFQSAQVNSFIQFESLKTIFIIQ